MKPGCHPDPPQTSQGWPSIISSIAWQQEKGRSPATPTNLRPEPTPTVNFHFLRPYHLVSMYFPGLKEGRAMGLIPGLIIFVIQPSVIETPRGQISSFNLFTHSLTHSACIHWGLVIPGVTVCEGAVREEGETLVHTRECAVTRSGAEPRL